MSKKGTHNFNHIYKGFNNILKLLEYQKYDISSQKDITIEELQTRIETNSIDFLLEKKMEKMLCYISLFKQLRPSHIQEYSEDIFQFRELIGLKDQLIIISKDTFNNTTDSGLSETIVNMINNIYMKQELYVNVFLLSNLQFNILEHYLIPKHIVLEEQEVSEIKKKFNITNNSELPTISRFDPMAKSIGLKPQQICKIIRPSKTTINSIYYRICI